MRKRIRIAVAAVVILVGGILLLNSLGNVYDAEIETTVKAINRIEHPFTLAVYTDIHHDPEKDKVDPLPDTMACMGKLFR